MEVDFPLMFGPVMIRMISPGSKVMSLGTKRSVEPVETKKVHREDRKEREVFKRFPLRSSRAWRFKNSCTKNKNFTCKVLKATVDPFSKFFVSRKVDTIRFAIEKRRQYLILPHLPLLRIIFLFTFMELLLSVGWLRLVSRAGVSGGLELSYVQNVLEFEFAAIYELLNVSRLVYEQVKLAGYEGRIPLWRCFYGNLFQLDTKTPLKVR
jgi:hypothetical protein